MQVLACHCVGSWGFFASSKRKSDQKTCETAGIITGCSENSLPEPVLAFMLTAHVASSSVIVLEM